MKKSALILGITGQDGSYMADLLLDKGYDIYGLIRRTSSSGTKRIDHCIGDINLIHGDITDKSSLEHAVRISQPHEIYNLAAQSHVHTSFEAPLHTEEVNGRGVVNLLETMRLHAPEAKLYQASSSEMFGNAVHSPQSEATPFNPVSPYACSKVYAHYMCQIYRKSYKLFVVCGIAFNHESPRRGEEFVTRKITQAIAEIKAKKRDNLSLGNIHAKRDWSHARDIMRGAWMAIQHNIPDDYVFASGKSHSVMEFLEVAFNYADLEWTRYVKHGNTQLLRPNEVNTLCGNPEKAYNNLGWVNTVSFNQLVKEMVSHDLAEAGHSHTNKKLV